VCGDISLFSSYLGRRSSSLLMRNGACAAARGVGTVDLKLTSGKAYLVVLCYVEMAINLCLNLISAYFLSMELLWVQAMRAEACSACA
jgi:hypothetical protein